MPLLYDMSFDLSLSLLRVWSLDAMLMLPVLSRLQASSHCSRNLAFGRMLMSARQKQSPTPVVLVWVQTFLLVISAAHYMDLAKRLSVVMHLLKRSFLT